MRRTLTFRFDIDAERSFVDVGLAYDVCGVPIRDLGGESPLLAGDVGAAAVVVAAAAAVAVAVVVAVAAVAAVVVVVVVVVVVDVVVDVVIVVALAVPS